MWQVPPEFSSGGTVFSLQNKLFCAKIRRRETESDMNPMIHILSGRKKKGDIKE